MIDDNLKSKVFEALGRASVCWENPAGAGEFDSGKAEEVGRDLLAYIREKVIRPYDERCGAWRMAAGRLVRAHKAVSDSPNDPVRCEEASLAVEQVSDLLERDHKEYFERLDGVREVKDDHWERAAKAYQEETLAMRDKFLAERERATAAEQVLQQQTVVDWRERALVAESKVEFLCLKMKVLEKYVGLVRMVAKEARKEVKGC